MTIPLRLHLALAFSALFICGALHAAELRTTSGNRTIFRTAELSSSDWLVHEELASHIGGTELIDAPCASCGGACQMSCITICNWYGSGEYLLWWRDGRDIPPLVTTDPISTPAGDIGVLAQGATVIFGNDTYGQEARPGGRITFGKWLDTCEGLGVEARFWMLGDRRVSFAAETTAGQILSIPYARASGTATIIDRASAPPGGLSSMGNVQVESRSDVIGVDALYRLAYMETATTSFDLIGGYHFSRIDEDIRINSFTVVLPPAGSLPLPPPDTTISGVDLFETRNEFHGGQIGLTANYVNCQWQVDLLAKMAFGNMRQVIAISGETSTDTPPLGDPTLSEGPVSDGITGRRVQNEFAVVPEFGAKLRYSLTECFDLSAGYSFVYWSDVLQPEDHLPIPNALSSTRLANFTMNSDSYWVHGVNFGAEVRY